MLDMWLTLHALAATVYVHARKWVVSLLSWQDRFYFPSTDLHVPARYLTKCLRSRGLLSDKVEVTEVIEEDLKGNRGLVGCLGRLRVTYSAGASVSLPKSFVIKSYLCNTHQKRANLIFGGSYREAKFYADMVSPNTPTVYYASYSLFTGEMVLIMEDMQGATTGVNFYFGNQIWGMTPLAEPLAPEDVLLAMYSAAADLHAKYWRSPALISPDNAWMKGSAWYRGADRTAWEISFTTLRNFWSRVRPGITPDAAVRWEPALVAVIEKSIAHTSWDTLQARLHDPLVPFTLTHGDFHASNMLMRNGDGPLLARLVMVDWSEVGPWEPCADLGQTMVSDVQPAVRRAHERRLVEAYWTRLTANGVSATEFPLETCWAQYQRATLERWLYMVVLLAVWGLPPRAMQFFHDQVWEFYVDHGCGREYFTLNALARLRMK